LKKELPADTRRVMRPMMNRATIQTASPTPMVMRIDTRSIFSGSNVMVSARGMEVKVHYLLVVGPCSPGAEHSVH
jgi:hypothetical protein